MPATGNYKFSRGEDSGDRCKITRCTLVLAKCPFSVAKGSINRAQERVAFLWPFSGPKRALYLKNAGAGLRQKIRFRLPQHGRSMNSFGDIGDDLVAICTASKRGAGQNKQQENSAIERIILLSLSERRLMSSIDPIDIRHWLHHSE
jgi:hypothetical protein